MSLLNINFKNGSSALVTVLLMLIIVTVASFGFIILELKDINSCD